MKTYKKYNITVYSTDLEVADKFYEQLIGLKLDYKNSKQIHLVDTNYDVLIIKQYN